MTSMKTVEFSRPPTLIVHLRPKFFHSLDLGCPVSNEPSPPLTHLQMITNQLKKKHNPRMTVICYQVIPSAFVFSMNSLILPGFPLTSFNLAEANLVPRAILKN